MTEKARKVQETFNRVCIDKEELEKIYLDMRGYAFDSLIYRFKSYQDKLFPFEVQEIKVTRNMDEWSARERVKSRHDRDLMRFIQILDEVIGEHS